jgi:phosphoesterase RecJ-like protein
LINPEAASNSEQLCDLYALLKKKPTREEAACLFTGILTDTGGFQHANTKPRTFQIASYLSSFGVDTTDINRRIFRTKSLPSLKLLGYALESMEVVDEGRVAVFALTQDMFRRAQSSGEDTEMVIGHGMMVPGALVSVCLRELRNPQLTKVSFRSREPVRINGIAESFGGGGHHLAAGCTVPQPLFKARETLLARIHAILPPLPPAASSKIPAAA